MGDVSYLALVQNIALLLASALVFDISSVYFYEDDRAGRRWQAWSRKLLFGLLLGLISMAVMLTPWQLFPGIRIDTRSVLLGISGLFFGPVPTLIAMCIAIGFRISLGGAGTLAGVLIILESGLIGMAWRRLRKAPLSGFRWFELYAIGILIHLVMLACIYALPLETAIQVLSAITLPVMVLFPVGTALLGVLLRNRLRRQKMFEELTRTTRRLNDTQLLTRMGGWEWDVEKKSMFWTDEVYRIHGMNPSKYPPESTDLVNKSLACYHPDVRDTLLRDFENCGKNGQPYDHEFRFTSLQGEPKWVHTKGEAVIENGKIIRVVGNIMDITERKEAEQELLQARNELQRLLDETRESRQALLSVVEDQKEAEEEILKLNTELEQRVRDRTAQLEMVNRELESFSYSVSHDLRAPLRALNGFSDALISDYGDTLDRQGKVYLTKIQDASILMGKLIDDLLNLSRITRSEMNFSVVDLSQIAGEICAELASQNPDHPSKFNVTPGLRAKADAGMIRIALSNLLQNALKYSGKRDESVVDFGVIHQSGIPAYFVRDNGAGFKMDFVDKLFSPFQRLHKASEFSGTGIGLSIVKRIINRHGGRIWAEAAVDQGATFYFTLWEKPPG
jgi:PAS domain S-box-containing protein